MVMAAAGASTVRSFIALLLLMLCSSAAAAAGAEKDSSLIHGQAAAKTWCVAKPSAGEAPLRANVEFACSESDCAGIQGCAGGGLVSRASAAMNAYYQARGRNSWNCFFNGTGVVAITDPSLGSCKYA